jgi:hypothetical protein
MNGGRDEIAVYRSTLRHPAMLIFEEPHVIVG